MRSRWPASRRRRSARTRPGGLPLLRLHAERSKRGALQRVEQERDLGDAGLDDPNARMLLDVPPPEIVERRLELSQEIAPPPRVGGDPRTAVPDPGVPRIPSPAPSTRRRRSGAAR